jgi:Cobalamin synthesis protein cobW C-terminal domain
MLNSSLAPVHLVAGPAGVGKTTWILKQCEMRNHQTWMGHLGSETLPIDAALLASHCRATQFLTAFNRDLSSVLAQGAIVYIEVGFHVDLTSLQTLVSTFPCHRIAIIPPSVTTSEWHDWADEVIEGIAVEEQMGQLWRSVLTGQILEAASLNTFWDELINGAYGSVGRAKGIFEVQDGRAFHFSYVAPLENTDYEELNVPRWVDGRPTRFSGIEVVGYGLDEAAIADTLRDCCLDDTAIAHYQAQLKTPYSEAILESV